MSQHSVYDRKNWGDIQNTFSGEDTNKPRGGENDYVTWIIPRFTWAGQSIPSFMIVTRGGATRRPSLLVELFVRKVGCTTVQSVN